jgi:hypothetical protein
MRRHHRRTGRDHYFAGARVSTLKFSVETDGFVFDPQTESAVRGFYGNDDLASREAELLFPLLRAEALSQTSLEGWARRQRRGASGPSSEKDRWHPVRVERVSMTSFRLLLIRGEFEDPKRREVSVTFTLSEAGIVTRWAGIRDGEPGPNVLTKEVRKTDELSIAAREAIRVAMGFLGRIDPYGAGFTETEQSHRGRSEGVA